MKGEGVAMPAANTSVVNIIMVSSLDQQNEVGASRFVTIGGPNLCWAALGLDKYPLDAGM